MELHGYLDHGYRVLSNPDPARAMPEILEHAEADGRVLDADGAVDRSALRVCADPSSLPFSDEMQRGF